MADNQNAIELNKLNADIKGKIAFMLITATTASIAYILTQIKNEEWNSLIYFPIFSLSMLALSFMFGCSYMKNQAHVYGVNSMVLQIYKDKELSKDTEVHLDRLGKYSSKSNTYSNFQYLTFILGVMSYAIYVLITIYIKTNSLT